MLCSTDGGEGASDMTGVASATARESTKAEQLPTIAQQALRMERPPRGEASHRPCLAKREQEGGPRPTIDLGARPSDNAKDQEPKPQSDAWPRHRLENDGAHGPGRTSLHPHVCNRNKERSGSGCPPRPQSGPGANATKPPSPARTTPFPDNGAGQRLRGTAHDGGALARRIGV